MSIYAAMDFTLLVREFEATVIALAKGDENQREKVDALRKELLWRLS